jgi:hypothetical protein
METLKFAKTLALILLLLIISLSFELGFPWKGGAYVGGTEVLVEICAVLMLVKHKQQFSLLPGFSFVALISLFVLLSLADSSYITMFYIYDFNYREWGPVLLTTFVYGLSFLAAACALISSFKLGWKHIVSSRLSIVLTSIFTPIALNFIALPYVGTLATSTHPIYSAAQGFVVVTSFCAAIAAFLVLLSTHTIFWASFSLGTLCLVFSDWAIRVEGFRGNAPAFGFYEFFWALGVYLAASSVIFLRKDSDTNNRFSFESLLCTYKIGTTAVTLIIVGALCVSRAGSVAAIKIVSLGCAIGAIISTIISHFLTERIHNFTQQLAQIISINPSQIPDDAGQIIPQELATSLRMVFEERNRSNLEHLRNENRLREAKFKSEIAKQVAHDIRSPLAALKSMLSSERTYHVDYEDSLACAMAF